jgi:ElaB/YqjD/DUF883 family membrane-anchored ribosome-binding protein
MANTVDQLIVEIKAETAGLRKGLDSVNRKLGTANKTAKQSVMTFGNLAKVFGAIGVARIGGAIGGTAREFQDLEATLKAVTGSAEAASSSFELIKRFTATTTFQVQNVATAFTTLLNAGIAPTSDTMQDFGNIAAAFGKDITQIAQATFNATTGEMEMLKQFGIKAKLEGDKIKMIFREQETEIDRDSTAIVGYLRNIAQENFATALEDRAKTASGAISNLKDAIAITMAAVGDAGLLEVMTRASLKMKQFAEDTKPAAEMLGRTLLVAFEGLKKAIAIVNENMSIFLMALRIFVAFKVASVLIFAASGFLRLAQAINTAKVAQVLFNSATKKNLILLAVGGVVALADSFFDLTGKVEELLKEAGKTTGILDPEENKKIEKSLEELNAEILANAEAMTEDMSPALAKTAEFTDELMQAVTSASNTFTNEFVNSLLDGQNALESFKNFSRNIVSQIISIFIQLEVVNRILAQIFPNFEGTVGTGLFSSSGGDVSSSSSGSFTGGMAGGGTIQKRQPTLVGERGAEIFIPNTGGTMLNNMNSKNAMGGTPIIVNQSVNFATGVVPTVRAEVVKMMPQIADVTKGAVAEAAMRGGNYRRMLQGG